MELVSFRVQSCVKASSLCIDPGLPVAAISQMHSKVVGHGGVGCYGGSGHCKLLSLEKSTVGSSFFQPYLPLPPLPSPLAGDTPAKECSTLCRYYIDEHDMYTRRITHISTDRKEEGD